MDPVFKYVVDRAKAVPEIEKVIIFGSRSRGDARENSDYDFCFIAPKISHKAWVLFVDSATNNSITLCKLDLIRYSEDLAEDLKLSIQKEGKVLYEKK